MGSSVPSGYKDKPKKVLRLRADYILVSLHDLARHQRREVLEMAIRRDDPDHNLPRR